MGTILFFIVVFIGSLAMVYGQFIDPKVREYKSLKQQKVYWDTTYLRKSGGTTTFGPKGLKNPILNYDLRSWDAGKNWYAVDYNFKTEELKILGEVEKIYPGLMKHLEAWDTMTQYAQKYGPIKLTDPEGVRIMEKAGFEIVTDPIDQEKK